MGLFLGSLLSSAALWAAQANLARESRVLEAELGLAKKSQVYYLLNTQGHTISLKAGGVLLRAWEIKKMHLWGNPLSFKPRALIKKSSLFPPKRERIRPEEQKEEDSYDIAALEVRDMPSRYHLLLNGGVTISVYPHGRGILGSLSRLWRSFRRITVPPLYSIWSSIRKKPFSSLDIELRDKTEAQSLYWALSEGTEGIIFFP